MLELLKLALAVAAISTTITRSSLFKSLRVSIYKRSPFLGGLFSCPYCMCHWIAVILVLSLKGWEGVALFISDTMAIVCMAAIFIGIIGKLIDFRAPTDMIESLSKSLVEASKELKSLRKDLKKLDHESIS